MKLGLKANALYRDGSKFRSPSLPGAAGGRREPTPTTSSPSPGGAHTIVAEASWKRSSSDPRRERERLPHRRKVIFRRRLSAVISGTCTPANMTRAARRDLIDMHKEVLRSFADEQFCHPISVGLQYGVPLEEFVDAFTFTRFEPAGLVIGNDSIKKRTQLLDYIFANCRFPICRNDLPRAADAR